MCVIPFQVAVMKYFTKPMIEQSFKQQQLEGELMSVTERALSAIPVVQAYGREEVGNEQFKRVSQHTLRATLNAALISEYFLISSSTIMALSTAAMMFIGGGQVSNGIMTVGDLLVFLAYLTMLYAPLNTIVSSASGYASAAASGRRVLEIMDLDKDVKDLFSAETLPVLKGNKNWHVRLENITFGYEKGRPVLHDVTIEAKPGEKIALVGETGSGKSTIASLIPRLFDPWKGQVTFNGKDIREFQINSLRSQVAIVLQEPFIMPLSVAENIAYGRPDANRDDIIKAAVVANADSFIRQLKEGYDTKIGERGSTLSGGQKQRLAIARALLIDAPILILDEPTSSLDAQTEALLMDALENLMRGRTTFIIAHRLSTIRSVDRIFVLKDGQVVETGSQKELLTLGGIYYRMYQFHTGS